MQAEGRASLSDTSDPTPTAAAAGARVSRTTVLLLAVAALALLLDQVSKAIIVATMPHREPIELLWGFLTITYTRNPGAAFSFGTGTTWVFTAVATVVVVVILRTSRRLRSVPWAICLGGLLGGALGNLSDRLFRSPGHFRGHVVDWIEWPHYPVFNIADCFVVCSVIGIVVLSLLGYELDGRRTGWAARRG
jgi:signal peptidase II